MMESWSYAPDELDSFTRSRKTLMGWEEKPSYTFDINSDADVDAVENMEFMGLGYARRPFLANTTAIDSRKRVTSSTCLVTSSSFFGKDESGSRVSSSCMESNSQDSTLIDLKLGRFVDCIDRGNGEFLKERSVVSAVRPPLTGKRTRSMSSYSQTPLCQVYGCNKDLSSSKDYHKRHRVCEVHTKTPKVVVNGSEQRFCQQCSRFHMLAEFDDSKRSCRKRLAGHNERRRKPQFNILSSKPHKLLQSYQGTKFLRTSLPKAASFVFPDILPGGVVFHEKHEQSNMFKRLKFEEEPFNHSQSKPITNGQLLTNSSLHFQGNEKQYSPGIPPWATESYYVCNASSTVPGSTAIPHAGCALSLLSAQSHNLPSNSGGILMPRPLINQTGRAHNSMYQNFDETLGLMSLERYATDGLYTSGMNSVDGTRTGSVMVPDSGHAVNFEIKADGVFQESNFLNAKQLHPSEHGSTVDLLQLSSHLKRVEQQRNSLQLKQQTDDLCCFPTS